MKTPQSRTATMPGIFGVLGFIMEYLRKRVYLAAFLCTRITQVFTNNLTNICAPKLSDLGTASACQFERKSSNLRSNFCRHGLKSL
jgi:hypothetical protein